MATNGTEDMLPEVGLLEAVWRYRWSSLLIIILSGLLAAEATFLVLNKAEAVARFAVTDPRSTTFLRQGVSSDSSYIAYTAQRAVFAESEKVLTRTQEILKAEHSYTIDLETLRDSVQAAPGSSGGIIEVQTTAKTDQVAANIANSVVQAYQELTATAAEVEQAKLVKSIKTTQSQVRASLKSAPEGSALANSLSEVLAQLQLKESDAQIDLATYSNGTRFVDQANPERITPSKLPKNIAIGLALGALIAIVIAFLRATNPIARVHRVTTGDGQRKRRRRAAPDEPAPPEPPMADPPPARPSPSPRPIDEDDDGDRTDVYDRDSLLTYRPNGNSGLSRDATGNRSKSSSGGSKSNGSKAYDSENGDEKLDVADPSAEANSP
ncbi:GumC domain-containing protein [Sphaerimonospora thailandensis]|uniref:Polysaccharide chain length determinant N-terminal domain-containing protein n=1 Tax=Sphaerimonospora thailandensis TaxID=795644 RepID=A0A8J3R5Y0_9ACTN|nr:hypothetical protein [Sphaerimonospora thailandensis]GIH69083.1 hypothetical protein Mth01_13360 [Sphaerimonospora thailandensis]